ncbi:MAG: immunoglobulin domain-containing protein, partial [Oscillospiraceae bacterium]|nr:immunoglobulin domain-containing protein [Oscillospiraceae bacterium]
VGTTIKSAKTDTLSFTAKGSYNGYQYRCAVTDVRGNELYSDGAALTIGESFAVTRQPENVTATEGESVTFAVKAVGAVSYQWQYSKNGVKWTNVGTTIKSAKTDTLSFTARGSYNGYQYRCAVTGEDGSTLISEPALLSVG